jgi:hypothetical protein
MVEPADDLSAMTPAERASVMRLLLSLSSPPKIRKARPCVPATAKQSAGKTRKRRKGGGSVSPTRD